MNQWEILFYCGCGLVLLLAAYHLKTRYTNQKTRSCYCSTPCGCEASCDREDVQSLSFDNTKEARESHETKSEAGSETKSEAGSEAGFQVGSETETCAADSLFDSLTGSSADNEAEKEELDE